MIVACGGPLRKGLFRVMIGRMTKEEIRLIGHAVGEGRSPERRRCGYAKLARRHFCATPGEADAIAWDAIVAQGWAVRHPPRDGWMPLATYIVTPEGFEAWKAAASGGA